MFVETNKTYRCEYCGMKFSDELTCYSHENECGKGYISKSECPHCGGTGMIEERRDLYPLGRNNQAYARKNMYYDTFEYVKVPCPYCH